MRILVTGGLGFIGHNVVAKLESVGHEVTIIDNVTTYSSLSTKELDYLVAERSKKIVSDKHYNAYITDYLDKIFEDHQPEIVIHLASFPNQKTVSINPLIASDTMIKGVVNVCKTSLKYGVKKLVFISSSMVYGDFCGTDRDEDSACMPENLYGILKLTGEEIVKDYAKKGLSYTIIRPSAVYGPSDTSGRVVAQFLLNAMHDKELIVNGVTEFLDFTHVEDAANGIVLASLSDNTVNKTYNISRGKERLIMDAAEIAINIAGKGRLKFEPKNIDIPSRGALNINLARYDFGYDPQTDIEEGFQSYYRYLSDSVFWNPPSI